MAKKPAQSTNTETTSAPTPPADPAPAALEARAQPEAVEVSDPLAGTRPPMPEGPQGIRIGFMASGDPTKDFHPRHRSVRMVDPASLIVDGEDPFLALPIEGDPTRVRIRQVGAKAAAEMLSCDPASGGQSIHRLATTEEAQRARDELAARARR